jgi:hypothetical protein
VLNQPVKRTGSTRKGRSLSYPRLDAGQGRPASRPGEVTRYQLRLIMLLLTMFNNYMNNVLFYEMNSKSTVLFLI